MIWNCISRITSFTPLLRNRGGLYMAETPDLPGCRAWAENAKETLAELGTVAEQFILSYKDRGKPLPEAAALSEPG